MIIVIFTTASTITIVITNLLIYIGVEYQLGCYYLLFFNYYYYYYYFVLCAYNKFNKVKSYLHVTCTNYKCIIKEKPHYRLLSTHSFIRYLVRFFLFNMMLSNTVLASVNRISQRNYNCNFFIELTPA